VRTDRQTFATCDDELRAHLWPGERILAVGRCSDITEFGGPEEAGSPHTYVMVTDRRLRWVPFFLLAYQASLDLDTVTSYSERMRAHRYVVAIEHAPLPRLRRWHAMSEPRDLRDAWRASGRLRDGTGPFTSTELAFSRPDTVAARALRELLSTRLP
jgi:hypothetical protein